MKKYISTIILALIVGVIIGSFLGAKMNQGNFVAGGASSAGTVQSTPQIAQVTFLGSATTTWASIYNPGQDRVIDTVYYYIPTYATGSTSQVMLAATSTNSIDLNSNTAYVFQATIASTTNYLASTTPGQTTTALYRTWPSGTYLNFVASATSSATGIIGVKYFIQ